MSKQEVIHLIKWPRALKTGFTEGVKAHYEASQVEFANPLLAPSTELAKWTSWTKFQMDKLPPSLPKLIPGQRYRLVVNIQEKPADSLLLRVAFFDRQNQLVEQVDLQEQVNEFVFPSSAVKYSISLISLYCTSFIFQGLELCLASLPSQVHDLLRLIESQAQRKRPVLFVQVAKSTNLVIDDQLTALVDVLAVKQVDLPKIQAEISHWLTQHAGQSSLLLLDQPQLFEPIKQLVSQQEQVTVKLVNKSEIAQVSSLTAVDLTAVKAAINQFEG